jgi:hypothetical protein
LQLALDHPSLPNSKHQSNQERPACAISKIRGIQKRVASVSPTNSRATSGSQQSCARSGRPWVIIALFLASSNVFRSGKTPWAVLASSTFISQQQATQTCTQTSRDQSPLTLASE